jgi:AraC family transcriptional activator of pobA
MDKTSRQVDFSAAPARVPRFFLYGEPPRETTEGFVHVETIADRSRLYDWRISPHAHRDLNQLLLITAGRGEMRVESSAVPFAGPALLIVPATLVHAFDFERETTGYVVSVAERSLRDLAARERALLAVFDAAASISLGASARDAEELEDAAVQLRRETVWSAPAQRIAAEARLAVLLVGVARALAHYGLIGGSPRGPRAALVARFRDVLDARFRSGWPLARYARELGVSAERLRAACVDVTGKPPVRLVHERLMLEAKRLLTYTHLTVAETAYELGFTDPAYFSRFFSEHAGEPPIAFRRRMAAPDG